MKHIRGETMTREGGIFYCIHCHVHVDNATKHGPVAIESVCCPYNKSHLRQKDFGEYSIVCAGSGVELHWKLVGPDSSDQKEPEERETPTQTKKMKHICGNPFAFEDYYRDGIFYCPHCHIRKTDASINGCLTAHKCPHCKTGVIRLFGWPNTDQRAKCEQCGFYVPAKDFAKLVESESSEQKDPEERETQTNNMTTLTPPQEDKVGYTYEQMNGYVQNHLHLPARLLGCEHCIEGKKDTLEFSVQRTHIEPNHCEFGKDHIYIDSSELEHHWKSRCPLETSIVEALEDLNNPIWKPWIRVGVTTTRTHEIGDKELPRYLDVDFKLESKDKFDVDKRKVYDAYTLGAGLVGREFRIRDCYFTPSPESFQEENITHISTAQTSTRFYIKGSSRDALYDSKIQSLFWTAVGRNQIKF